MRALRSRLALSALLLGLLALPFSLTAPAAHADGGAAVRADPATAAPGATATVTGTGWPGGTLLTVLLCGQNALSGTDSCANPTGRAVTTGANGGFTVRLPIATPPKPCPCVIHTTTVTGPKVSVDTSFPVIGAPVVPLPTLSGRLVALNADLGGESGLMNWFGAPAHRTLKAIIANLGDTAVANPVFQLGTSHSVYAPGWQDFQWSGVLAPGAKQEIDVPVDFASGAHGDYELQLRYAGGELTTQEVTLPRSWGVTLFWLLLCVVIPVGLFRIGLAVVDRMRPDLTARRGLRRDERRDRRTAGLGRRRAGDPVPGVSPSESSTARDTLVLPPVPPHPPAYPPARRPEPQKPREPVLPWFSPGTVPLPTPAQVRTPGSPSPRTKESEPCTGKG
ncbi:hypothetical protein ABIA33_005471 [Streptacidiphilus sp. MAP12-16]|uniref:hypothetical protein n=1 Tax=Streptacidiphilus sp. MAP12-16 TaxID=3156300 RepID=UPI0035197467